MNSLILRVMHSIRIITVCCGFGPVSKLNESSVVICNSTLALVLVHAIVILYLCLAKLIGGMIALRFPTFQCSLDSCAFRGFD